MLKIEDLEKIDSNHMFKAYDRWPEISQTSFEKEYEKFDISEIDHIVFAGMGGSGSIGDSISGILSKSDIHVTNVKGYLLPKTVDERTLVVVTSVSGNTDESLTILKSVIKTPAKIASFSSGGKFETFCSENDIFFQSIPMTHSPRASYPSFLFSILNVLEPILPISQRDIKESCMNLRKTRDNICSTNLIDDNESLKIAKFLKEIVCVYYPAGLQAAAIRYKNSLQENAKNACDDRRCNLI
jgi:Glucose-6-phosphate isomerase